MMKITGIDHLVLTVRSIETACKFYCSVLGMTREEFAPGRVSLKFGSQKVNLHEVGKEFEPKANIACAGSADICFIVVSLNETLVSLQNNNIDIEQGPVNRTGANGPIRSIYIRDPDKNLIELSTYIER